VGAPAVTGDLLCIYNFKLLCLQALQSQIWCLSGTTPPFSNITSKLRNLNASWAKAMLLAIIIVPQPWCTGQLIESPPQTGNTSTLSDSNLQKALSCQYSCHAILRRRGFKRRAAY